MWNVHLANERELHSVFIYPDMSTAHSKKVVIIYLFYVKLSHFRVPTLMADSSSCVTHPSVFVIKIH